MGVREWVRSLYELVYPQPALCPLCGIRVIPDGLPICVDCVNKINPAVYQLRLLRYQGYALSYYHDYLKQLLYEIKYQNRYDYAVALGEVLGAAAKEQPGLEKIDYFLPVPLHQERLKKRGFNQAEAFTVGMNRVWPHPVYKAIRHKPTEPQSELSPKERLENLRDAFALTEPALVKDKRFLIIDDIFTTGATFYSLADLINRYHGIPIGLFIAKSG
jgi:ComF family protein